MIRTRNFLFAALAACCLASFHHGAALAAGGAEISVAMVQQGIDTRDLELVGRYLDVDGVVGKAVETVMDDPEVMRVLEKTSFPIATILALGNAEQTALVLRNFLTSEVKEYIRHGVVSGAFAGKPVEGASTYQGVFAKAFRGGEKNRVVFRDAAVKKKGKTAAIVSCTLESGKNGRVFPLELRVEPYEKSWRIVELHNASSLVKKAMEKKE